MIFKAIFTIFRFVLTDLERSTADAKADDLNFLESFSILFPAVNFSRLRISDAGRRTADRTNALFGIFKKSFNGHPACTLAKRERKTFYESLFSQSDLPGVTCSLALLFSLSLLTLI